MTIGRIITAQQVEDAAKAILDALAPAYLAQVAADAGIVEGLPDFRSITSATDTDTWPEDQLPAAIVICPGLAQAPEKHGVKWDARWAVGIGIVVSSRTRGETMSLVKLYTAAIRTMFLQNQSLGGFAQGMTWEDERYDELPNDDSRTIAGGQAILTVDVSSVVDSQGSPSELFPVDVEKVHIDVTAP